jgi:hypothetical protein
MHRPDDARQLTRIRETASGGTMSAGFKVAVAMALVASSLLRLSLVARQGTPPGAQRVALISELSGTATIQQPAATAPAAAARFDALLDGTIVRVGRDSRIRLVLASGKRFTLNAGTRATVHSDRLTATSGSIDELPALPTLPPLVALEPKAPAGLGGVRLRSDVITGLSPADGTVLAAHAALRFAAVQGAGTYRVEIEDRDGHVLFGIETRAAEVPIPPQILEPGARYYWTVQTIDRPGAQARGGAAFDTLAADAVTAREALRSHLSADGSASSLALLAAIDLHLGLHREALEEFRAALGHAPDDDTLKDAIRELEAARHSGNF